MASNAAQPFGAAFYYPAQHWPMTGAVYQPPYSQFCMHYPQEPMYRSYDCAQRSLPPCSDCSTDFVHRYPSPHSEAESSVARCSTSDHTSVSRPCFESYRCRNTDRQRQRQWRDRYGPPSSCGGYIMNCPYPIRIQEHRGHSLSHVHDVLRTDL
ncbi:hypothetical protein ACOME3_002601 [Neoechinorhynchus agilis]